jgi:hypothetical protein
MPDLATLPRAASVFVDTNIFDLHYQGRSATCSAFMARVASGEVTAYVNTHVLSDLLHKLMLAEACLRATNAPSNILTARVAPHSMTP